MWFESKKQISSESAFKNTNHYGEATFVYFCSKFINNFILEDLKNNFYTFRKLLYNNLKLCQIEKDRG
jgi:hypothetical protein